MNTIGYPTIREAVKFWRDRPWRKQAGSFTALPEAMLLIAAERVKGWRDDDPGDALEFPQRDKGEALGRFQAAMRIVCDAILEEKVEFALTEKAGGEFLRQVPEGDLDYRLESHNRKPHVWNIENPFARFMFCEMSLHEPLAFKPIGTHRIWILTESLKNFLSGEALAKTIPVEISPKPSSHRKTASRAAITAAIEKCIRFSNDKNYRMLTKDEAGKLVRDHFADISLNASRDMIRAIISDTFAEDFSNTPGPQTNAAMRAKRPQELEEFRGYLASANFREI
ncbi:hypothetical protein WMC41_00455 [Shinella yambaruensis]|uniref:hypothetical protein n=1 Tax=Shinella yambaruensis TaxID=415996 RepID=UPI003D793AE8